MTHTREQAVDTELLVTLADYGKEMSKNLRPGVSEVSVGDLLRALCRKCCAGWCAARLAAPPRASQLRSRAR